MFWIGLIICLGNVLVFIFDILTGRFDDLYLDVFWVFISCICLIFVGKDY